MAYAGKYVKWEPRSEFDTDPPKAEKYLFLAVDKVLRQICDSKFDPENATKRSVRRTLNSRSEFDTDPPKADSR